MFDVIFVTNSVRYYNINCDSFIFRYISIRISVRQYDDIWRPSCSHLLHIKTNFDTNKIKVRKSLFFLFNFCLNSLKYSVGFTGTRTEHKKMNETRILYVEFDVVCPFLKLRIFQWGTLDICLALFDGIQMTKIIER